MYWVVGEDGTHKSKDPLPKAQAKAQLRALYANTDEEKTGAGIVDDIRKALSNAYNEVADMDSASWKKVKRVGDLDSEFWVTNHLPTDAQAYLDAHGDEEVTQVIIRRAPVRAGLEVALELVSAGKWEKAKKDVGYDAMFHLSLILNRNTILEKLARINIGKADNPPDAEVQVVKVKRPVTLREMVEKTKTHMGDKFYPYDPFHNNCQDFVDAVLTANSDVLNYDTGDKEFVKQSMGTMIRNLPDYLPKFARTITSLGGLTGGANETQLISAPDLLRMCQETYALAGYKRNPVAVGQWKPIRFTRELVLYNNGSKNYILAVRGTKEFRDVAVWKPVLENGIDKTSRFVNDEGIVRKWLKSFPGTWYGTGHSLGGALVDNLIAKKLVGKSMTFNPAIEPEFATSTLNQRVYFKGDTLLAIFGRLDPKKIVVSDPEPAWISWLFGADLTTQSFDGLLNDVKLGGAEPGGDVDVEELFSALEDLVGGAFAPKFLYETAESRTEKGARPRELVRSLRDVELGLRAIAHREEAEGRPLSAFGARVMADDAYEHTTGEKVDWGHDNAAKKAFIRAFRDSRGDQVTELGRVNSLMAQYELPRDRAYGIAYEGVAPPRRAVPVAPVARVRPAADIRAEMEAEERRAEDDRRMREEDDRRMREEALRRQRALEDEEQRVREEEARRVREELARQEREEEERKAREAEEEARRYAEEKRLEQERQRGVEAEADRARAEAVRLAKVALAQTDEFQVALDESAAVNALLAEKVSLQSIERQLKSNISMRKHWVKNEGKTAAEVLANPEAFARIRLPITGSPRGTQGQVMTLKTPPLPMKTILANIQALEAALPDIPEEMLSSPVGKTLTEEQKESKQVMLIEVEHPNAWARDEQTLDMILPPPLWRDALESFKKAQTRLVEDIKGFIVAKQKVMSEDIPKWERESEEAEAKLVKVEREIASIDDRKRDLEKQFEARAKERAKLAKVVAQAKPKKKGKGGQHKDFKYSSSTLTPAEKARERAAHYRRVEREKAGAYETPTNVHATKGIAYFDAEGKELNYYDKDKTSKGKIKKVALSEEGKEREAARGLKPTKEKVPKKDSVRKPYVGSKMKEQLFMASSFSDHTSKEFKSMLRRASKLYKAGGRSWESVMKEVLGQ